MRYISPILLQRLSDNFQIGTKAPSAKVFFFDTDGNRITAPRVLKVDIERRFDMYSAEFEVELDNTWGWLSPHYSFDKFPFLLGEVDRGDPVNNPWGRDIIYPNRKIEIHLGYGDELIKNLTGLIDRVVINAETKTITLTGRDMYKHLIEQTIKDTHEWKETPAKDIIVELVEELGLEIEAEEVLEEGTGEPYVVPELSTERARAYDYYVAELLETTYSNIHADESGKIKLYHIPEVSQHDREDYVLDEFINLTEAEFTTEDFDIFTNVIIEGPGEENDNGNGSLASFQNDFLRYTVCMGQHREKVIRVPWADTYNKKKQAARTFFRRKRQSLFAITVGAVGHPGIELYDIARISEHVTTASQKYLTQSIRTTFDENGYFDLIDLELAI